MNPTKWPPEYDSVKVIVAVIIIAIAGFFVYKYMHNGFDATGRVINTRRGAPVVVPTPSLPVVTLLPLGAITKTSAVLNAKVPVMNEYNSATLTFEYGLTTKFEKSIQASAVDQKASATITGLSCGKTYHYRLIATNAVGTSGSEKGTVRTLACR